MEVTNVVKSSIKFHNTDKQNIIVNNKKTSQRLDLYIFVHRIENSTMAARFQVSLHKKWSFPLRISLVNVSKSAENCGFDHISWGNP